MSNEEDEPLSRLKAINGHLEHLIDFVLIENMGCALGCLAAVVGLVIILAIGMGIYSSIAHANQHCVHATREYVLIGHVETPQDVCDTWQNN